VKERSQQQAAADAPIDATCDDAMMWRARSLEEIKLFWREVVLHLRPYSVPVGRK
jgi:hypothetical protein